MNHALAGAVMALFAFGGALWIARNCLGVRRPSAVNHRGSRLPVVLGFPVVFAVTTTVAGHTLARLDTDHDVPAGGTAAVIGALLLTFLAGLYDDLRPQRVRGIAAQVAALGRRQVLPGVVKLAAAVTAALLVVGAERGASVARRAVGVAVIAGCANLWNLLDVAPGRSLKAFLLAGAALLSIHGSLRHGLLTAATAATLGVLAFDLRERAMLGDAGANPLGALLGLRLAAVRVRGVRTALFAAVVALNLASERVSFTKVIEATPGLRELDRLGRRPA